MAAEESRDFLQAQGQGCPRCPVLLRLSCAGWAGLVGREGGARKVQDLGPQLRVGPGSQWPGAGREGSG